MKNLLFLFFMLFSFAVNAQPNQSPVIWKFDVKKSSENTYTIYSTAIIEKGWHVFTTEPGGDGLLIPTAINIDENKGITISKPFTLDGKFVTHDMEFVGKVNYVEGIGQFTITVISKTATTLKGLLTYQCCNEKMCLPPTDVPFSVELK